MRSSLRLRAIVPLFLLLATACTDYSQLAFRQDTRLHFTEPRAHALVSVPVTLSWMMRNFGAGSFAVFVDRAPVQPGHTLRDVADGDPVCLHTPSCPSADYLSGRGVYTTTATNIVLTSIPPLASQQTIQLHEVEVVLLDPQGRRIGESAWHIEFKVRKRTEQ